MHFDVLLIVVSCAWVLKRCLSMPPLLGIISCLIFLFPWFLQHSKPAMSNLKNILDVTWHHYRNKSNNLVIIRVLNIWKLMILEDAFIDNGNLDWNYSTNNHNFYMSLRLHYWLVWKYFEFLVEISEGEECQGFSKTD